MEYSIEELIPQRKPFLMVDELQSVSEGSGTSVFEIKPDNVLVEDGMFIEAGLIENMAQTAAAVAGYHHLKGGASCPPLGMIGELRNFVLNSCPKVGEHLTTTITEGISVGNITTVNAKTMVGDTLVAESSLKISIEGNGE